MSSNPESDGSGDCSRRAEAPLRTLILVVDPRSVEAQASRLGLAGRIELRKAASGEVFVTDGGHLILDAAFGEIPDAVALSGRLGDIPGVVEHGLFIGLARGAIIAGGDDLAILGSLG